MSEAGRQFASDRIARDHAKVALDARLAQVREDLAARGLGGRIADRVVADATDVAVEAADLARAHKGLVAGTIVALVLWVFRNPLIAGVERLLGIGQEEPAGVIDTLKARVERLLDLAAEKGWIND